MQSGHEQHTVEEIVGLLWTWWRGDALPLLTPTFAFTIEASQDVETLAHLTEVSCERMQEWFYEGHRGYLVYRGIQPVAVGLSAIGRTGFGGGQKAFSVSAPNRYLYGFVTLPELRGQGIYPRLLQYILQTESKYDERFWILHQITNRASEKGISRAGFGLVGQICRLREDGFGLRAENGQTARAHAGARLLDIALLN